MTKRLGVIVGRFQTPELHEGHRALLNAVVDKSDSVLIALSSSANTPSKSNPLPYEARRAMLNAYLGECDELQIEEIFDCPSDQAWSDNLDKMVYKKARILIDADPNLEITLYGGRDSFIPRYYGRYQTLELELKVEASATAIREAIQFSHSQDFLRGMVYTTQLLRPRVFPTVDIALTIRTGDGYAVLLGRKENEEKWRFPGGFVDPSDPSFEYAAIRELREETLINLLGLRLDLIEQRKIRDWRYSNGTDALMTSFFHINLEEMPNYIAGDDLKELKWFQVKANSASQTVQEHVELFNSLRQYLDKLTSRD